MKKALLVIDMQIGISPLYEEKDVLDKINNRINNYRSNNDLIIFIQHSDSEIIYGSDDWNFYPDLAIDNDDVIVEKTHPDSFLNTNLESILNKNDITDLEIVGAQIEYCIDTTIKVSVDKGYKVVVPIKAVTTIGNEILDADSIRSFYKLIWKDTFVTILSN